MTDMENKDSNAAQLKRKFSFFSTDTVCSRLVFNIITYAAVVCVTLPVEAMVFTSAWWCTRMLICACSYEHPSHKHIYQ
jgi:hypothetical protein